MELMIIENKHITHIETIFFKTPWCLSFTPIRKFKGDILQFFFSLGGEIVNTLAQIHKDLRQRISRYAAVSLNGRRRIYALDS